MRRPEQNLQISVVTALRRIAPGLLFAHFANGGARTEAEGRIFKAMGVRAGAPDLMFVLPPDGRAGFIELKAGKGALTASQKAFSDDAVAAGAAWACCRSLDEVIETLGKWGALPRVRAA